MIYDILPNKALVSNGKEMNTKSNVFYYLLFLLLNTRAIECAQSLSFKLEMPITRKYKPIGKIKSERIFDMINGIKNRLAHYLPTNAIAEIVCHISHGYWRTYKEYLSPKERVNIGLEFLFDPAYASVKKLFLTTLCTKKYYEPRLFSGYTFTLGCSIAAFAKKKFYVDEELLSQINDHDPIYLNEQLSKILEQTYNWLNMEKRKKEIMELVYKGADLNVGIERYNPLYKAIVSQHIELITFLIEHGASPQTTFYDKYEQDYISLFERAKLLNKRIIDNPNETFNQELFDTILTILEHAVDREQLQESPLKKFKKDAD